MPDSFEKVESLANHVREYVDNRTMEAKLEMAGKSSRIIANGMAWAVVAWMALTALLFLSIGLALWLAKWTGELFIAFLIVAGLYLLAALLVYAGRKSFLQVPVMNRILKQILDEDEEEDEED